MQLIWFERNYPIPGGLAPRAKELEDNGFTGTMYPYGIFMHDYFTRLARYINVDSSFKHIIAIRPYVISPQYLSMLCSSIDEISKNRIAINLLTGWIYDNESQFGGVMSEINDKSSNVERSNFMLEYAKEFRRISKTEFYISTTNDVVFDACDKNDFPMIIPYSWYKIGRFNLTTQKYLISVAPIIRDGYDDLPDNQDADLFTKESFFDFLDTCKKNLVYGVLLQQHGNDTEYDKIKSCIKEYTTRKIRNNDDISQAFVG